MPCYRPLTAYRTGSGQVVFSELRRHDVRYQLQLACQQCIGCRLERSRLWAIRVLHESKMHERSAYITLTYKDEHVPPGQSLRHRDFQLFMKRLRKGTGQKVRYYMAGEYGEHTQRPHYHAALFGIDFPDQKLLKKNHRGDNLYSSAELEKYWPLGYNTIGAVTFESAAYIARYIMKKITGQQQEQHYKVTDTNTGEIIQRIPEYNRMSLKPGIGATWLQKYYSDVYPGGQVLSRGHLVKPPRYYDNKAHAWDMEDIQFTRHQAAQLQAHDNTPARLAVKEQVAKARVSLLKRKI